MQSQLVKHVQECKLKVQKTVAKSNVIRGSINIYMLREKRLRNKQISSFYEQLHNLKAFRIIRSREKSLLLHYKQRQRDLSGYKEGSSFSCFEPNSLTNTVFNLLPPSRNRILLLPKLALNSSLASTSRVAETTGQCHCIHALT